MAEVQAPKLHVVFLPFMAPGHSIPMLDMARQLAARQVKTSVLATPKNAPNFAKSLNLDDDGNSSEVNDFATKIHIIPFPSPELTGLPEGVESQENTTSSEMLVKFFLAMELLKDPVEQFVENNKPDCIVADNFFPFATEIAAKFGIKRLVFHVTGCFPMSVMMALHIHQPYKNVKSEDEPFVIPDLPHEIRLTKSQLQPEDPNSPLTELSVAAGRAILNSFGIIFNSFRELEPDYIEHYKTRLGRKIWQIGPVSLCRKRSEDKCRRGKSANISEHECLDWLNSKPSNSVIYVSFGSLTCFSASQLREIAVALDNSGLHFVWTVREPKTKNEEWLPVGFEKRIEGRGLVIRGWAPQVLILDHEAVGGFVTHCGWNSLLEGVSAGLPMATWPVYSDHFYSEKLITEVLKIGVQVGSKQWSETTGGNLIRNELIEAAIRRIMVGDEAIEMRRKAKKLKEMAYKAVEEGGSSYCDVSSLLQELSSS